MSVDDSKGFVLATYTSIFWCWQPLYITVGGGHHSNCVPLFLVLYIIDKHFICIIQEISHIAANSSVKLIRLVKHINCFYMTLGLVHSPVLAFHASFLVLEQLSP